MDIWYGVVDTTERVLAPLGLMTGEYAIPKRMITGGLVGALIVSYLKPSSMYYHGQPRPWSLLTGDDSSIPPTNFPWYFASLIGAFILGVLI